MEGRLRQLLHIGVEALSEGLQIFGGDGDAHGRPMAPEALREIRDRLHRLEEIHVAHGAPRAAGLVAVDGEQERRHPVGVHEAGSHDTLHALVPALAGHDKRPLAVVDPAGLLLRDVRQLRLDGAPLVVHVLQGLGHGATLAVVVAHEQIERQIGIAHAPGGVQARDEGERQVRGRKRFAGLARGGQKRGDAGARIGVHASEAVGHKGPVLVAHGHEVGHGAQGGEVGVAAPQMRKAQAAAEHLHELQGHAHAGEDSAGAIIGHLRIGHGNALGHKVGRLVVVGDVDLHPCLQDVGHLALAGNAAIHGDDDVRL